MSLVGNEDTHALAVIAALNAGLPASVRAYDLDDLPATRPADYLEVTVSRRAGGELRSTGATKTAGWRVTTRAVSKVSVSNARTTLNKARLALEFVNLSVGGKTSTPVQFETQEAVEPDDGWWSGLIAWTYAL